MCQAFLTAHQCPLKKKKNTSNFSYLCNEAFVFVFTLLMVISSQSTECFLVPLVCQIYCHLSCGDQVVCLWQT